MVDRRKGIEGNTLKQKWENNPEPPPMYGVPDPRMIVERIGSVTWAWSVENTEATIDFYGETISVRDNELENRPSND